MNRISFTLTLFLIAAIGENVATAREMATVFLTSQVERCEGDGENKRCEHFAVPKMRMDVPLELLSNADNGRIWVGTFEDRRETGGFSLIRRGTIFRMYSAADNEEQVNTVSAWQTIGPEHEQMLPPIVSSGVKNIDDLPLTMLSIPGVKRDGRSISSQLVISGMNTAATDPFSTSSHSQSTIFKELIRMNGRVVK